MPKTCFGWLRGQRPWRLRSALQLSFLNIVLLFKMVFLQFKSFVFLLQLENLGLQAQNLVLHHPGFIVLLSVYMQLQVHSFELFFETFGLLFVEIEFSLNFSVILFFKVWLRLLLLGSLLADVILAFSELL